MGILQRALTAVAKYACYRSLGLVAYLRKRRAADARCRRVLLSEISLLGDVVSFTACLGSARRFWPEVRIDVLVLRRFAPLLSTGPDINAVMPLHGMGPVAYAKTLLAVRRMRYDLVLSMSPGLRNAGIAILGGGRAAAGYLFDRGFPPSFLNPHEIDALGLRLPRTVEVPPDCHIADRGLRGLAAFGAEVPDKGEPELVLSEAAQERVERFLAAAGIVDAPLALLHPSAGERGRRWPLDRFAEVARRLSRDGLRIVWTGTSTEHALVARALSLCGAWTFAFVGRPTDELAALIARAALFVGNDSGPMHIAGALGIPLVGVFGTGDPARLLPRNPDARAVGGPHVPGGVGAVTVDEVMEAARQVLGRGHND